MSQSIGPLLSDEEFFTKLVNTDLPGLAPIADVNGDYARARKIFAAHVRGTLNPEKYFAASGTQKSALEQKKEEILAIAEDGIRHHLTSTGTPFDFGAKVDWYANPTYNKYKEWTWQLSRHHEPQMCAYAYLLTGDERYAAGCCELLESWIAQAVRPERCDGHLTLCWRTIECGIRMGLVWPEILHCIYNSPNFTDDLLVDWYKSVWEHGQRLHLDHTVGNNWYIHELNGLGQIGILYPEFRQSPQWLAFAISEMEKELDAQVYPDGFQYELSTGYQSVCVRHFTSFARIAAGYGVALSPDFLKKLERMLEVYVKLMRTDGTVPSTNDGGDAPVKEFIRPYYGFYQNNRHFRYIMSDAKEGEAPEYTSIALPYSGLMVMRTGWGEHNVWAFLDAGPFGFSHQHEDKLSLLISSYGKNVLTNVGKFAYDDSPMRQYCICSRAHNTVRVNGKCQNRRVNYHKQVIDTSVLSDMRYAIHDDYDFASGIYDEGYGNPGDDAPLYMGATHQRNVLFLKNPPKGLKPFFIVTDRLTSQDENLYELLWHVDAPRIGWEELHISSESLHILTAKNGIDTWLDVVRGQQSPEWQGWKTITGKQQDWHPIFGVRTMVKGGTVRVVSVLYPTDDGSCPITAVEAGANVADTAVTLRLADGSVYTVEETAYPAD